MELRPGPFERGDTPIYNFIKEAVRKKGIYSVLDIGPGIRPLSIKRFSRHVCLEPCEEYVDILEENGYNVIQNTAEEYLKDSLDNTYDLIFIADVIEHMEKDVGLRVIEEMKRVAKERIILYTPLGFVKNAHEDDELDPWGLGGVEWQIHRSGWLPNEFPGWETFVDRKMYKSGEGGFAAVLEL